MKVNKRVREMEERMRKSGESSGKKNRDGIMYNRKRKENRKGIYSFECERGNEAELRIK